jgi:GWxTD domain-containing protein
MITVFLSQMPVQRLGWTLLHFLWQGTAIALVYAIVRGLLARSLAAQARYVMACAAFTGMAVAPVVTYLLISGGNVVAGQFASWTISASMWQQLLPGVVAVWMAGVLAFSIRLFGGWRFIARLRSTGHPAPVEWQQCLDRIAERVGATRSVRLLVSSLVNVPTVIGWLRPVILVPIECLAGLPAGHITALLGHEVAHIRRHDYLASILQSIVEAMLFYHPAVWWISDQIRSERELCCDDLAVAACGDVLIYARALAELETRRPSRSAPVLAANGGSLVNRIRRLVEPTNAMVNNLPGPGAAWAMMLLWFAGTGMAATHAVQVPPPLRPVIQPEPVAVLTQPSPVAALANHARRGLLYDPFLPAQLAQSRVPAADDASFTKWLNEDVANIVTDEERKAFGALTTAEERARFVEQFWLRRDPTPGTVENEYKEEHYRRIAYANEHFASHIPGWKTDRGRIYITFGPPDEIDSRPAVEDWRYRYVEGVGNDVDIQFADPTGMGEYRAILGMEFIDEFTNAGLIAPAAHVARIKDPEPPIDNRIPVQVQIDYVRVTGSSTMAIISVQFENRDLQFQKKDAAGKTLVNLFGRITTMTRRPVTTFERPIEIPQNDGQKRSVFQELIPLPPGGTV